MRATSCGSLSDIAACAMDSVACTRTCVSSFACGRRSFRWNIWARRAVPSIRSTTLSSRVARRWMSSRSSGVTKLLSIRFMISCVITSASCSRTLICAANTSSRFGSLNNSSSTFADRTMMDASASNMSKNPSSFGINRTAALASGATGAVSGGGGKLRRCYTMPQTRPQPGSALEPAVRAERNSAPRKEIRTLEESDQQQARQESTHVRPHRDAAGGLPAGGIELGQPAEHLNAEPVEQHQPSRNAEDLEEDQEVEEHVDPHARKEHEVRAHHARDRARCADGRHGRRRIHHDLRGGGDEPAQQVEGQETHRPHHVLDGPPEDPEKECVAEDVHPAAVQEEREQRRDVGDDVVVH